MKVILIILGSMLVGYWGLYAGERNPAARPLLFQIIGPIALIIGIALLIIGFNY